MLKYTYYEVLDVRNDATHEEIAKAYRSKVSSVDPDSSLFDMINEAYLTLKDTGKRRAYDLALFAGEGILGKGYSPVTTPAPTAKPRTGYRPKYVQDDDEPPPRGNPIFLPLKIPFAILFFILETALFIFSRVFLFIAYNPAFQIIRAITSGILYFGFGIGIIIFFVDGAYDLWFNYLVFLSLVGITAFLLSPLGINNFVKWFVVSLDKLRWFMKFTRYSWFGKVPKVDE